MTATAKVAGARPAVSIRNANRMTATRIKTLGYQRPAVDRRPFHRHAAQGDDAAEDDEADAQQDRHVARPHARDGADLVVAAEPQAGEPEHDQDDRGAEILRVRLKTSSRITKLSQHEPD